MPPRGSTNPAPKTESAREAVRSFYCELCNKGYARMNEFEAHESSYDHQHKKRLKEMKQMQRDPLASSKARRAELKADEKSGLVRMKLDPGPSDGAPSSSSSGAPGGSGGSGGGGGFKKGGFKSAFGGADVKMGDDAAALPQPQLQQEGGSQGRAGFKKVLGGADDTAGAGAGGKAGPADRQVEVESDTDVEYEYYDPRRPTDCDEDCPGHRK